MATDNNSDFMSQYRERREQQEGDALVEIKAACIRLVGLGVVRIEVEYDGACDEGSIQGVTYFSDAGTMHSGVPKE